VNFLYLHQVDGQTYRLDTREMRGGSGPGGLEDPSVFVFVREDVRQGLKKIGARHFSQDRRDPRGPESR
jgi:hypothetical protein